MKHRPVSTGLSSPPVLQVQRQQQDLGGVEGAERENGEVGPGDAAVFEQGQVQQRRRGPPLPDHEPGQQHDRGRGQRHRPADPQRVPGPDHSQHQKRDPGGRGQRAGNVQAAPAGADLGGSSRIEAASSAMPIGTLTKNTSRQVISTRRPPSTAPDAKPAETIAP